MGDDFEMFNTDFGNPRICAPRQGMCAAECAWRRVNDAYAAALKSVKLSDVVADNVRLANKGVEPEL